MTRPASASSIARGLALLVGAVGLSMLAAWIPLLEHRSGQFVLAQDVNGTPWIVARLSTASVLAAVAASGIGVVGCILAMAGDGRLRAAAMWLRQWIRAHPRLTLLIGVVIASGAVDFYELFYDPFNHKSGLFKYKLRDDVQIWMFFGAAVMGGLALSAWLPEMGRTGSIIAKVGESLSHKRRQWWLVAMVVPCVMAAVMCRYALNSMPHFSDSLTYLMQGRMLYNGQLSMPTPAHPELWRDSLFFLTEKRNVDAQGHVTKELGERFFGKYPIGWPAILGTFDHFHVIYLANAVLVGLVALLTGLIAREIAGPRIAVLAALGVGLSPWVWFHGSSMASHVASTCALMAFIWLFLVTMRQARLSARAAFPAAFGTGLALGAAILIRPGDATNFALPVAIVTLYLMIRRPRPWLAVGPFMALGPMAGAVIYLWVNSQLTGSARISPYKLEPRWITDWDARTLPMLARSFFQWVELNGRFPGWGLGGVTVGVLGLIAFLRRQPRYGHQPLLASTSDGGVAANVLTADGATPGGLWLLLAATTVFFFFNTAFGLTNVWWGPRWLLPVVPVLAILAAFLADNIIEGGRGLTGGSGVRDALPGQTAAAQFALSVLAAGLVVGLVGRFGGQFYQNRIMPPHQVSAAVDQQVRQMGLHHAVVAMDPSGARAPLDARAGIFFMDVPLESNDVVYVRAVSGWEKMVRESFADRAVYRVDAPVKAAGSGGPLGFEVKRVGP